MLIDRVVESGVLAALIATTAVGDSGALVVRGEPGIGVTSLLDQVTGAAVGVRVIRGAGVEAEMRMPFAGLHQLLAPFSDRFETLPAPQRDALEWAFGERVDDAPDRFLVGLAALSTLSDASEDLPIVGVLDDAQWLDVESLESLAFVARRLGAEPILLVFVVQDAVDGSVLLEDLPELRIDPLDAVSARELLGSVVADAGLDERVRERLVEEAMGNPLALTELATELGEDELSGLSPLPDPLPMSDRLQQRFIRQLRALSRASRGLLVLAASDPSGDPVSLWAAAALLGIGPEAADERLMEGLLSIEPHVTFRHPLIRMAVQRAATLEERRDAHEALAGVAPASADPDRRMWHLAAAAVAPDEDLAAGLEASAGRARVRGGTIVAAEFLERAAQLTSDPRRRAERTLAAAKAELEAGAVGRAAALVSEAAPMLVDAFQRALAQQLRGAIAIAMGAGAEGAGLLLESARAMEPYDVTLARAAHLEALEAAIDFAPIGSMQGLRLAASAGRGAPAAADPGAPDLLLGLSSLIAEGHETATDPLRRAVTGLRARGDQRWLSLGARASTEMWDDEAVHEITTFRVQLGRDAGSLRTLPSALAQEATLDDVPAGRLDAASVRLSEALALADSIGDMRPRPRIRAGELLVAAWRGRADEARSLAEGRAREAIADGLGGDLAFVHYATAVLELGLGRYHEALAAAREAVDEATVGVATMALPELVEAGARGGEPGAAAEAELLLEESTLASGTEWALGTLARSRALVAEDRDADELYRESIRRLRKCRVASGLARSHLLYGEWLRRERHQRDARDHLRRAHEMFVGMGAEAFAERANTELQATGERADRSRDAPLIELTPQEAQIARLVSDGASNPEIAAQMFISRRTVEYHLSKVFKKLGVSSRTQLTKVILEDPPGLFHA